MKTLAKVVEVENEGLMGLLGEDVLIFCVNYIYCGKLVGLNETYVKLENAKIVYETGSFQTSGYRDAQALPKDVWYVQLSAIESFGFGK